MLMCIKFTLKIYTMERIEEILIYTRDSENLFSIETIDAIEITLDKIRLLNIKWKTEASVLITQLFEELSKDDIWKELLKIYRIPNKPKKGYLFTLIYLKDLLKSIEKAIDNADDDNVLLLFKKLVYDYFDNFDYEEIWVDGNKLSISELKDRYSILNPDNNYWIDFISHKIIRLILSKYPDFSWLSIWLQLSLMVQVSHIWLELSQDNMDFEWIFSNHAISKFNQKLKELWHVFFSRVN